MINKVDAADKPEDSVDNLVSKTKDADDDGELEEDLKNSGYTWKDFVLPWRAYQAYNEATGGTDLIVYESDSLEPYNEKDDTIKTWKDKVFDFIKSNFGNFLLLVVAIYVFQSLIGRYGTAKA